MEASEVETSEKGGGRGGGGGGGGGVGEGVAGLGVGRDVGAGSSAGGAEGESSVVLEQYVTFEPSCAGCEHHRRKDGCLGVVTLHPGFGFAFSRIPGTLQQRNDARFSQQSRRGRRLPFWKVRSELTTKESMELISGLLICDADVMVTVKSGCQAGHSDKIMIRAVGTYSGVQPCLPSLTPEVLHLEHLLEETAVRPQSRGRQIPQFLPKWLKTPEVAAVYETFRSRTADAWVELKAESPLCSRGPNHPTASVASSETEELLGKGRDEPERREDAGRTVGVPSTGPVEGSKMGQIEALPMDIVQRIIQSLPLSDRFQLARTSKRMKETLGHLNVLDLHLLVAELESTIRVSPRGLDKFNIHYSTFLEYLTVAGCCEVIQRFFRQGKIHPSTVVMLREATICCDLSQEAALEHQTLITRTYWRPVAFSFRFPCLRTLYCRPIKIWTDPGVPQTWRHLESVHVETDTTLFPPLVSNDQSSRSPHNLVLNHLRDLAPNLSRIHVYDRQYQRRGILRERLRRGEGNREQQPCAPKEEDGVEIADMWYKSSLQFSDLPAQS